MVPTPLAPDATAADLTARSLAAVFEWGDRYSAAMPVAALCRELGQSPVAMETHLACLEAARLVVRPAGGLGERDVALTLKGFFRAERP